MATKLYRAYNFDLDTKKLKEHFKNYTDAYRLIEASFKKYHVEHRQGSGYVTSEKISAFEAVTLVKKINSELNWLSDCTKRFDLTDVGETFDLTHIILKKSNKTTASDKLPEGITNKLAAYQRDSALRGEVAATQTLNNILDRPAKATSKANNSQIKKTPTSAAKCTKKSKGKSRS